MRKASFSFILSACQKKQRRHVLSFILALAMMISLLPPIAPIVSSEESSVEDQLLTVTNPGVYSTLIGCNAELNFEYWSYIVISDDPAVLMENGQELVATDILEPIVLVIEDCHWVEETCALWLKVRAADGYTLPAKLQQCPWIFQNYTDVYEEDDWQTFSPDALMISYPAYTEPASIVSDEGITVSSDNALFTDLIVTQTQEPSAYYISNAVAYNMTPRTNEGKYTGHADVSIPIPEGWDSEKVFGFVVEDDGTITALLGTVTKYGTFRFTVPHFSEVGLLEATAVDDVLNKTIVFGKVNSGSTEYVFSIEGQQGEEGRFVSDDGAVQYVVNHYTSTNADGDTTTTTYVSLTGLDVTPGTEIIVGNTSVVVIVNPLENTADKLLTGGAANSEVLNPLYDVGISGSFDIDYTIAEGGEYLTLSDNTITAEPSVTGHAIVKAEIKHPTSGNVVGHVTYNVTISAVDVTNVNHIHVPAHGAAEISGMTGTVDTSLLNTDIATISVAHGDSISSATVTIDSQADEGITYFVVGEVLYVINTNPNNPNNDTKKYISIEVDSIKNCTAYYAINGGPLYPLTGANVFFEQDYVDGVNIMFFCAPDDGYVTSTISATGSDNQYYSLSNGSRYDGSDTDAWPFDDANANTIPSTSGDDAWVAGHGLRWCLLQGNLDIAQMRDLFTRALALGCDSVTTFTKNDPGGGLDTTLTFAAEKLPSFEKTIIKIKKASDSSEEIFTEVNPYDPAIHAPLEIGDTVTYQFAIDVTSTNITYDFTISDGSIDYEDNTITGVSSAGTHTYEATYVIGKTGGVVDEEKIKLYANGEFTNTATLSYTYKSSAASGKSETVSTSSVTCRISSIVTWMDNNGTVWSVQNINQGGALSPVPVEEQTGYEFTGWDYQTALDKGYITKNGDSYTVNYGTESSFTIYGEFKPNTYQIDYVLDGGDLPDGVTDPTAYTIEDLVTIPTPTKEGHTFNGWIATLAEGNWTKDALYAGGYILPHRYGNVTLEAQWTINTYTVTWVDEDGTTVLETDENVPYGTMPSYDGAALTKEPINRYKWIGWDKELVAVTEDVTYIAKFDDALGDNHKVYIGINIAYHQPNSTYNYYNNDGNKIYGESYHQYPAEPYTLHDILLWRAHLDNDKWVIDQNWGSAIGVPKDYINENIFSDSQFVSNDTASGIFDPSGELVKEYFDLSDDDYEAIIQTWLSPTFAGPNTDINWRKVSVKDCAIVPYVIKLQDNGNWYIDMVIVVQETSLTIAVGDNLDGNTDHTFLYKITAQNHAGFELVVGIREGETVTIHGLFPGKTYYIEELTDWSYQYGDSPGWTFTTDGDTDASDTGAKATIVLGTTENKIDFTNTYNDPDWLGGECRNENIFEGVYTP